jgi:CheY-like chemotaxis protein
MDKRVIFYLIDEDENQTETMHKLILKVFPTMYVKRFTDGFSAWKSLEKEKLEVVIISEYDLQGINGLQILKKLRTEPNLKDTYFIMMSGSQDRDVEICPIRC